MKERGLHRKRLTKREKLYKFYWVEIGESKKGPRNL